MATKPKKFFKGIFNLSYQMIVKYRWAFTKQQAKVFFMREIAREHNIPYNYVFSMFNGEKDNFSIEEE